MLHPYGLHQNMNALIAHAMAVLSAEQSVELPAIMDSWIAALDQTTEKEVEAETAKVAGVEHSNIIDMLVDAGLEPPAQYSRTALAIDGTPQQTQKQTTSEPGIQ